VDEPDETMTAIGRGIALSQRGEREAGKRSLTEIWAEIGAENGDPLHRCALAHAMADLQDDVREELVWDLRALEAAHLITDDRAARAGVIGAAALYPSLHLNLGDCYRRLGEVAAAGDHLRQGLAAAEALPDDGYARMVKGGLQRLGERLTPS
jgi:hypothetical protein